MTQLSNACLALSFNYILNKMIRNDLETNWHSTYTHILVTKHFLTRYYSISFSSHGGSQSRCLSPVSLLVALSEQVEPTPRTGC